MRIELEELFKQSLLTGINLFIGAGFSTNAKNISGENIPLGAELALELSNKFHAPRLELSKVASIIESKNREEFYEYLREKFSIGQFDNLYKNLELLKITNIYTTNIDNLIFKIFEDSTRNYINDTTLQGPSFKDRNAINYYPLHGCVLNKEKPMVFTSLAIASSFSGNPRLWSDLIKSIESVPTLFWGYSLADPGILETLNTLSQSGIERNQRWIVLHREKPEEEEYFKALGFNIIIASNSDLLSFFDDSIIKVAQPKTERNSTRYVFGEEFIPSNPKDVPVREINEFYLGAAPSWSDIFRADLYKTSHFRIIQNSILSNKNTIVIGIPGSGKTTLLMQLAAFTNFDGHKIILEYPSIERMSNILNKITDEKVMIFIDNFTEEVQSFLLCHDRPNIKLIGFDREHNFEIVSHLIKKNEFNILSVTTLAGSDIQEIYSRIPLTIKSAILKTKKEASDDDPSLFEFLNLNLKVPSINERYKSLLEQLDNEDELLSELLVLASYIHYCRTPLSFEMVYSYFSNSISNYEEVYELRDKLGSMLVDSPLTLIEDEDQDYFSTRSVILSEVIVEQVSSKLLKRVLNQFVETLPPYKITNYRTFRKKGHDKFIAIRAFHSWEEGKAYYERLMTYDPNNPYLLQQGALYLSHKQQYNEAFYWIDKARNMTGDSILSIRNTHAIILFDANIRKHGPHIRATLDNSMQILTDCYREDKRKLYHAKKFAEQALDYFNRYGDDKSQEYLLTAKRWIEDELKTNSWHRGLSKLFRDVKSKLI